MIKRIIFLLLFPVLCQAQMAFNNQGDIKIHSNGNIGFHIDVNNDGSITQDSGTAGFYNTDQSIIVTGTQTPQFYNLVIDVLDHLFLENSVTVTNTAAFLNGDVITNRTDTDIALQFKSDALYDFVVNSRKVDGYASITGVNGFEFPIGQNNKLRPLSIINNNTQEGYSAAYFYENPSFPSTFNQGFYTNVRAQNVDKVSSIEYWDLNGLAPTKTILTWDVESQIPDLTTNLQELIVVGWSRQENKWVNLGNTAFTGNLDSGTITSSDILPYLYDVITIGKITTFEEIENIDVYTAVTPNNDGYNDFFHIDGVEFKTVNLFIYNRWGRIVYNNTRYDNSFNGKANRSMYLYEKDQLPAGTYFYTFTVKETGQSKAGYLYVTY